MYGVGPYKTESKVGGQWVIIGVLSMLFQKGCEGGQRCVSCGSVIMADRADIKRSFSICNRIYIDIRIKDQQPSHDSNHAGRFTAGGV
jgi:hypothetical protein